MSLKREYIALVLSIAVFFVFAGTTLLKTMPTDMHGCSQGPCAAAQASADFCITHCLDAAQAHHGTTSAVIAFTLGIAAILYVYRSLTSPRRVSFRMFAGVRSAFLPLYALQTVVLRE